MTSRIKRNHKGKSVYNPQEMSVRRWRRFSSPPEGFRAAAIHPVRGRRYLAARQESWTVSRMTEKQMTSARAVYLPPLWFLAEVALSY
ncbi:hypothetical protein AOLI_G00248190 [Acnodon oligacanthus]